MSSPGPSIETSGQSAAHRPSGYRKPGTRRLRFIRAYWVTFRVLASYLWLNLRKRMFGSEYYETHLAAAHTRNAHRIERTILDLQGLFIKVGQLISIMTNFLPEEFRRPLEALQDQVPPRPFAEICKRIETELGSHPDELFKSFDRVPLASASLGQAHRAVLHDGSEVVVKVQHADIDAIVRIDLKTIWRIMLIIRWFVPVKGMDLIYRQIREMVVCELDFIREADFMERIGEHLRGEPDVSVPQVQRAFSTGRVLTTSYIDGVKVSDLATLDAWSVDRPTLAQRIVRAYCRMIFIDGLYHADPHPGNVMVRRDGAVVLLDFGAVAELSPSMRKGIADFLEAVIKRDTSGIHRAMRTMGFIARGPEAERASERIVEYFHRKFQDEVKLDSFNLKDIKVDPQKSIENILDLRRQEIGIRELTSTFQVPKDWVLLERTLLLLAGVCTHLDPQMNPMITIRPYLEQFVLGKDKDFATLILSAIKDSALSALSVPEDFRKYMSRAMRGELEVRVRGLEESAMRLYALGQQLLLAFLAATLAGISLVCHFRRETLLSHWAGGVAGFFLILMFLAMLRGRRPRK